MTDDLFAEFPPLDLGDNAQYEKAVAAEQAQAKAARAMKTKSRRHHRRAKSEQHLATILPKFIEPDDAWHVISAGDIDSLSYLAHAIKNNPFDHVIFSTWCMAMDDVLQIKQWCETGKIGRLEAYVGEIFPNQYGDEYDALCEIAKNTGGRVCTFKNHSKIFACRNDDYALVIESSANINTNPRCENTVLTADLALFEFQKEYFDGIRSFNRNFDEWTPYQG